MNYRLLAAAALIVPALAAAQTAPGLDPARLRAHVQTLGSDAFEGRGPATRPVQCRWSEPPATWSSPLPAVTVTGPSIA